RLVELLVPGDEAGEVLALKQPTLVGRVCRNLLRLFFTLLSHRVVEVVSLPRVLCRPALATSLPRGLSPCRPTRRSDSLLVLPRGHRAPLIGASRLSWLFPGGNK